VTASPDSTVPGSFRDPAGFLYVDGDRLLRHVDPSYAPHYDHLLASGLYEALVQDGHLVPHREVPGRPGAHRTLEPERIPFVSYPSEWTFGQRRAAALLTLDVTERALDRGMVLKDASAYNVQFRGGRPVLIDTLSFEVRAKDEAWPAYRQFCEQFLGPLAVMALVDPRLGQWSRVSMDGLPLDLAARLLPRSSWLRWPLFAHVHLHARSMRSVRPGSAPRRAVSETGLRALFDSLRGAVRGLTWNPPESRWLGYYGQLPYTAAALAHKKEVVDAWLDRAGPRTVWDLGANTAVFSTQASRRGIPTVAFDSDIGAVETAWRTARRENDAHLLPLVMDLANPTGDFGWDGTERQSLRRRGPADGLLALALVHHLVLTNHVPLPRVADFLAGLGRQALVEFVPPDDPQVVELVAGRHLLAARYDRATFEESFGARFEIEAPVPLRESGRVLYPMRRR
jgi:ribosomal protein L11 methylase PrmA